MLTFDRLAIVDAYAAYAQGNKVMRDRMHNTPAAHLSNLSTYSYKYSVWETISSLDDATREHYFELVGKLEGYSKADELRHNWERIGRKDGVTIFLETSDEDPFRTTAHIHDRIASAWCDAHGSLDGGTWEECDGPEFCYDILNWHPGQIEALQAEGYNFNFSQYSEPDERDIEIMNHAAECESCQYDYSQAKEHAGL